MDLAGSGQDLISRLRPLLFLTIILLAGPVTYQLFLSTARMNVSFTGPDAINLANPPSGASFDNIVMIAMENKNYGDVLGSCTPSNAGTCSASAPAPFITSLLVGSAVDPTYRAYGTAGRSANGCSAGCYVALISGSDHGVSNGYSCCVSGTALTDRLQAASLTWAAYCESGCPRGNDHFPFTGMANTAGSPSIHSGGSTSPSDFIAAANSASPPNFLWFTPTDSHNMHDNSVSSGDAYIKSFLVGSGTISNPAPGSLFASNLFQLGHRTLFLLWWDENSNPPEIFYGSPAKHPFTSLATYDHYSTLRMMEDNWNLPTITSNDAAATGMLSDMLITGTSSPTSGVGGGGHHFEE